MVAIDPDYEIVTLINVFTVTPEKQEKLVQLLIDATQKTMRHITGFVSASIHKSADGTRVTNYAQWRSAEAFQAMLKNPIAIDHMKPIAQMATNDAHLYRVVESVTSE